MGSLDALAAVGRNDLWFNENKMLDFAKAAGLGAGLNADLAPSHIARRAFETRPATWQFVEIVAGEFDDVDFP